MTPQIMEESVTFQALQVWQRLHPRPDLAVWLREQGGRLHYDETNTGAWRVLFVFDSPKSAAEFILKYS